MNPHKNSDGDKVLLFHVWQLLSNLSWRSYLRDVELKLPLISLFWRSYLREVEFKVTFNFLILKIIFEICRI
jgi:hypothetical protein